MTDVAGRGEPPGMAPRWWVSVAIGVAVGAFVVAISWNRSNLGDTERWWAVAATIVVAANVAVALPTAQRLLPTPGMLPFVIFTSLVAVYGCVPETDQIPPVAALAAALVVVEVVLRRRVRLSWHAGVAALVLWAGVYGATGRQSALVGALFAWWPVLLVPLVADLVRRVERARELVRWVIAGLGSIAAVLVARTGALEPTVGPAVVAVVAFGGVSLGLAVLVAVVGSARGAARGPRPVS